VQLIDVVAPADDVVYVGRRTSRDEPIITIETPAGEPISGLPHIVRSAAPPGGLEWGYGGAGPRDLARSLLLHALGDAAVCHTCGGSGYMRVRAEPSAPQGYVTEPYPVGVEPVPEENRVWCGNHASCDEGYTKVPVGPFLVEFVRTWPTAPGSEWRITRRQILAWMARRSTRPGEAG
jgi:hypothetical protein